MGVLGGAFRYGALLNGWKGAGLGEVRWVDLPSKGGFLKGVQVRNAGLR